MRPTNTNDPDKGLAMTPPVAKSIPHYLGITGVQTALEVRDIVAVAEQLGIGPTHSHTLMLGALVSPATVSNGAPIHTEKPYRHAADREALREILLAAKEKNIVGMLHFELHKKWPGTAGDAASVISLLRFLAASDLHPPVQLNGVVLPEEVRQIHEQTGVPLVLQLRKEITQQGTQAVLSYIESVQSAVAKIILDPSAGAGEAFAVQGAVTLKQEIEDRFPGRFTYVFAGGLGGGQPEDKAWTTSAVKELRAQIPSGEFSVDSETKVRRAAHQGVGDVLDIDLCKAYLSAVRSGLV